MAGETPRSSSEDEDPFYLEKFIPACNAARDREIAEAQAEKAQTRKSTPQQEPGSKMYFKSKNPKQGDAAAATLDKEKDEYKGEQQSEVDGKTPWLKRKGSKLSLKMKNMFGSTATGAAKVANEGDMTSSMSEEPAVPKPLKLYEKAEKMDKKENEKKENGKNENEKKENEKKEDGKKENEKKENEKKEDEKKENGKKENGKKEDEKKENGKKENGKKEDEKKEEKEKSEKKEKTGRRNTLRGPSAPPITAQESSRVGFILKGIAPKDDRWGFQGPYSGEESVFPKPLKLRKKAEKMDPISMQGPSASQATAQEDRFLNHIPQRRAPRDNPPSFAPQRPAPRNDPFSFNPQISAPKDDRWDPQGRGPNSGEEPAVPKPLRLHKKAEKMDLAGTQGPSAPRATAQEDNTLNYIPQRSAPNNDLWDPEDRGYTSEEEFFAGKGRMLGGKWWPNRSDVDEWLEIQKRCGRARPDENASLLYARYTPPLQLLPPEERLGFALQRDREVHEDFEVHENYKVYENYTVHEDYLDHDDYQYHNRQKGQRMSSAQNTTLGHVAQMDEASADIPQLPRTNKAPAPYKTKTEAEYVAEVYRARKARKYRPTLPSILSQQEPEENREPEKHDDPDEAGSLLIKGFEDSVDVQPRVDTLRTLTGHHHRDSNKSEDFIQHDLPPMSGANGDIAILSQSANPSLSSRRNAIMGYKNDSRLTNKEDDAGQPQQIFSDTSFVTRQKHPYYFDKRGLFGKNVDYWPAASTAHKRFPRSKACACIGKPGPGWPNNGNPDLKSASLEDAQSVTEGNEQSATQSHSFDEVEKEAGSKTSNESEQSATPDKVETKASNRASNESEQSATPDNAENKSGNRFGNGSEETAKPDEVEKKASDRTSNESEQSATPDEAEKKAGSNTTQRGEASLKRVKRNMGILIEMCKAMILFTQNDVYHKRMDAIERRLKDLEEALKRH